MQDVKLYNVKELSELLSLGRTSIYELVKKGLLHPIKIGKATRFRHSEVVRFLGTPTGGQ